MARPELAEHFEQLFQHEARSWQEREEANLQLSDHARLGRDYRFADYSAGRIRNF